VKSQKKQYSIIKLEFKDGYDKKLGCVKKEK